MNSEHDDLCSLGFKNETELLARIRERFEQDKFYNFLDDILVVVNPCKSSSSPAPDDANDIEDATIPDAVSKTAEHVKHRMQQSGRSQCVLLTGESGSGKTEVGKQLLQSLVNAVPTSHTEIKDGFIKGAELLEAFGNACTTLSDNASRFIKLTDLMFSADNKLIGGYIHHYLLEKGRLLSHSKEERTFNIFYHFMLGMNEDTLQRFNLQKAVDHRITGSDLDWDDDNNREHMKLSRILENMNALGFLPEMTNTIFSILAAIIHIRDLTFTSNEKRVAISNRDIESLRCASALLDVTSQDLEMTLVTDIAYSKGSPARRMCSVGEAAEARDAMCMALYQRMFAIMVWRINQHLSSDDSEDIADCRKISILDPFGFENVAINGFDQLCINTVNEQLSHFYNQHVFVWEQDDRESEGLLFQRIEFPENRLVNELLLERPGGIFAEVDEHSKSIKCTDVSLVKKLNSKHRKHPGYDTANSAYPAFTINHFAGKVTYTAVNILSRNKDVVKGSIIKCLQGSTDVLIGKLFKLKFSRSGAILGSEADGSILSQGLLKKKDLKKMRVTVRRRTELIGNIQGFSKSSPSKKEMLGELVHPTLTGQLRFSLSDLLNKTLNSDVHFVRCIKPNIELVPGRFDDELVTSQLKYSGIMATIDMRQQGYPVRIAFVPFIDRYKILAYQFTTVPRYSANTCEVILSRTNSEGWKLGKTKVFMRNRCRNNLEDLLEKSLRGIVIIQKLYRGRRDRRVVRRMKYFQKLEHKAATLFLQLVEARMDTMYNHICNQVSEEDRRINISHCQRNQQSEEEVKEKALGILEGRIARTHKQTASPVSTTAASGPCNPVDLNDNELVTGEVDSDLVDSCPGPPIALSVVDAFDFCSDIQPVTIETESDVSRQEVPVSHLSILEAFGLGSTSDELSPGASSRYATGSPKDAPNSQSITDVFGVSNEACAEQSDKSSPGDPTEMSLVGAFMLSPGAHDKSSPEDPTEMSLVDAFMLSPGAHDKSSPEDPTEMSLVDAFMLSPGAHDRERERALEATDDESINSPKRPQLMARDSYLSAVSTDSQDSVDEDVELIARSTSSPWCMITCHERDKSRAEFTVDRPIIVVDGSKSTFDVRRIGLGALPMQPGDAKVDKVRRCIGRGITLAIDEDGSLWVKRHSKNAVFVKGYFLSADVLEVQGVLPRDKLVKVFDYDSFVAKLEYECRPKRFDPEKGQLVLSSVRVCISFVTDSEHDVDTPCWLEVVMAEPLRIAEVAVKLAKEKRREELQKRGERTPPILRAKIGKSRTPIVISAFEKKIRPGRYIDSFKFGRRDWARKRVSVNPYAYGEYTIFNDGTEGEESPATKNRSQSTPADVSETLPDENIGERSISDEVFSSEASDTKMNLLAKVTPEVSMGSGTSVGKNGRERTGAVPTRHQQDGRKHLPRSESEGGLTKVWARKAHGHKGAQRTRGNLHSNKSSLF